jgi:hypothetical protein
LWRASEITIARTFRRAGEAHRDVLAVGTK